MSEYTKEQEAEALERAAQYSDMESRPYWRIVLAMAKRTAEAEAVAKRCDGHVAREAALESERDALKARVVSLERALSEADNDRDALRDMLVSAEAERAALKTRVAELETLAKDLGALRTELADRNSLLARQRDALKTRVVELEAKAAPPPVVVTREMVEALSEFARTWARFGADCEPENAAARLVVALREAQEVES